MFLYNVGPYFPLLLLVPVRIHICAGQVWVCGSVTIPLTEVLGVLQVMDAEGDGRDL